MSGLPVLSLIVWLPILGALVCLVLPTGRTVRVWGVLTSLGTLVLAALAWAGYDPAGGLEYRERVSWIGTLGLEYHLGLDGLSAPLLVLNSLLAAIALAGSGERAEHRGYAALLLTAEGAVAGALLALDLALFFVFWETMLLPVVLLVGTYGGAGSARAAVKFFLYTTTGSLLMLLTIIALPFYADTGGAPLDVTVLVGTSLTGGAQMWLFMGFAIAFLIKMPLVPLHTWLPGLYRSAPLPALAFTTMLVKVGAYGFLRIAIPIFPDAAEAAAPLLAVLSVATILYGGALAFTSSDLVGTLAYSSVGHMGFIGLGIWSLREQGLQGAVLQMVNHGITAAALFLLAAYLLRRSGTLEIARLGGFAERWPVLTWLVLFMTLSNLGLPGLNSFVGEFLILWGAFAAEPWYAAGIIGVLLAVVYSLRYFGCIFHGEERGARDQARDLRWAEVVPLLPLLVLIVALGLYPRPVLDSVQPSVRAVVDRVAQESGGAAWR